MASGAGISGAGRAQLTAILASGRRFVTPDQAAHVLGVDACVAAKRLARWADNGWLRRVQRGLYLAVPADAADPAAWTENPLIVAAQVWPGYFTGWTAASYWSLTDQSSRVTVLKTTTRVRAAAVRLLDNDYLISTAGDMSWGLKTQWFDEYRLRFADPARAVVEILDSPRIAGGIRHGADILATYLTDHEAETLLIYSERLGNRSVFKRLGFLVETLGLALPDLVETCLRHLSKGLSKLDPDGPAGGSTSTRWRLRVNVRISPEGPS